MSIRLEHITKAYDAKPVLTDFSLEISDEECVALMGESGAGKTTILRILMGLEQPDAGTVCVSGGRLAVVFQENRLCEEFSVWENLCMVLPDGGKQSTTQKLLEACLARVGLAAWKMEPVTKLSGGMKRRVAIVRAVAYAKMQPCAAVLLDEPFKGLDDKTREMVMEFVREYTQNQCVLLVTHDREEAEFFSKRTVVIA